MADATKAVHATREAGRPGPPGTPVVDPIVQSANFGLNDAVIDDLRATGGRRSYSYTRLGNPTNEAAARVVAALEGAEHGAVVASGMAAIMASVTALLPPGGRLVAAEELYGDAADLFERHLVRRPDLELVAYPLLEGHPDHALARRLLAGGGGIVTVRVPGGDAAAHRVQDALRLIQPATSLGGTESVVCIPAETSHLTFTDQQRFSLGILPGTLRFSFGLEDPGDLLGDLAAALSGLGA
jgi:cystathionine beta-lyase/cystathionine gamma-synthase